MQERLLLNHQLLHVTILRLCHQLIEKHGNFNNTIIIGLQPRGIYLAERIAKVLLNLNVKVKVGYLDTTFHRDDFRRRDVPLKASETRIDFLIEGKEVILVDDVLYTGRSVRAALDAMISFGRPKKVEFLTLIDRLYSRDVPIEATYVGKKVNTLETQKILVKLIEQGGDDSIWLMNKQLK
jgi:pyrimidine operon attenuation protein/uracil phosphoribosyltransferase